MSWASGMTGRVREQVPLAPRTTWRIGGPARFLVEPAGEGDLARLLTQLPDDLPRVVLGGGSNVLVADAGFDGVVIDLGAGLAGLTVVAEGDGGAVIRAGAGATVRQLAHFAQRLGLAGAEFLAGIPGSVGGAVRMNAGAYGGEIKGILVDAELMDAAGVCHRRDGAALGLAYRQSQLPPGWVVTAASFRLGRDAPGAIRERMRGFNRKRAAAQPLALRSAGSTFKNPPGGELAWRLIARCGLRGARQGEAQVSEKHCNFLVNRGQATSADMLALIARVQESVARQTGVRLALEVGILGCRGWQGE